MCINYTDIVLITITTTTTTTLAPEIPCNANVTSGGEGVTESFVNLSPSGGLITFAVNAQSVPDKLEIIHHTVKKATTGMTTPNEGPFDNLYGEPTVPTVAETNVVDQFIGASKGTIPDRQATFTSETGSALLLPGGYQQLVWWEYTNADYIINPVVVIRITGPSGTGWSLQRLCPVTTTTTTAPPVFQHDFGDTGNSNPTTACGLFSDDQPKYSLDSVLSINTLLYNDPGLTTLWDGGGISWHTGGLPGNTYVVGTGVNQGKIISVHVCV
jgi:hypothetical protein